MRSRVGLLRVLYFLIMGSLLAFISHMLSLYSALSPPAQHPCPSPQTPTVFLLLIVGLDFHNDTERPRPHPSWTLFKEPREGTRNGNLRTAFLGCVTGNSESHHTLRPQRLSMGRQTFCDLMDSKGIARLCSWSLIITQMTK